MTKNTSIRLFNEKQIRSHWDNEQEKWYFSIIDVVRVLTESIDANAYCRSVPSPKAEPFKLWLSRVGRERIDEIEDPDKGIDRLE